MFIEIKYENCLSCECCVNACRRNIFRMGDGNLIETDPEVLPLCMHCGHCAAVCPGEAIVLDGICSTSLTSLPSSVITDPDACILMLKSKRSIGEYSTRPVPKDIIEKALAAANYAPSASGRHPVKWLVLSTVESRARLLEEMIPFYRDSTDENARSHYRNYLNGIDTLLRNAPCILIAYAPEHPYGIEDCSAAITYASLALHSLGVGSCWAGSIIAVARTVKLECLPVPANCRIYAAMMVGYPDSNFMKLPHRPPVESAYL